MISRIYLAAAAVIVAFFLYLSSINKEKVFIGAGGSGWEVPVILLLFLTFLAGFMVCYLVSAAKKAKSYITALKGARDKKVLEKAEGLLARARKAFLLGDSTEGELLLRDCISSPYKTSDPYVMLLQHYLDEGSVEKAFEIIDRIPPALSKEMPILFYKAKVLLSKESYSRAIDILKELDAMEGSLETKRLMRDAYMMSGSWDKASDLQEEILKIAGKGSREVEAANAARIGQELAKKASKDGKEAEAVKMLKDIVKKWPASIKPYVTLGKLYWKKGDKKSAEDIWNKGYEKSGNFIFVFLLEDYFLTEGEPQRIIEIYKDLIARDSGNAALHLFLGKLYLRLEMLDEGIEMLNKAKELDDKMPHIERMLGEAYFRKGEYKVAAEQFKSVLGFKRKIMIPFVCRSCKGETFEWDALCPHCGEWETLHLSGVVREDSTAR